MDEPLSQAFARWRSSRNPRLLAEVFDRTSSELLRIAIHLVGEPGIAEDLVQATFLTAIERAASFDESRRLEPWLAGILENHAHELARSAARTPDPQRLEQRLEKTPLEEALARELSAEVAAAVDRLPEPYRRTLLLRVRHGLAPADIAHVLGESPGAVRVRLHRALELLRKQLPTGIALGALFALESARGMSSVKAAVLAAGGGGVLVLKKVLVAAAVLALLLLGWWRWPALSPEIVAGKPEPAVAQLALETPRGQKPEELSIATAGSAARTAAEPASAQPVFHFRGQVVDGESSEPLANATVELYPAQRLTLPEIRRRYHELLDRDWQPDWAPWAGWPLISEPVSAAQRTGHAPMVVSAPPEAGARALASTQTKADGLFDFIVSDPQGFLICRRAGFADRLLPMRRSVTRSTYRDGKVEEETFTVESVLVRMFREYEIRGVLIDELGERVHEQIELRFDGFAVSNEVKPAPIDDSRFNLGHWALKTEADGTFRLMVAAPWVGVEANDARWSICGEGVHPTRHERWVFDYSFTREKSAQEFFIVVRRTPLLRVRDRETKAPIEDICVIARGKVNGYAKLCGRYFAAGGVLRVAADERLDGRVQREDLEPHDITVWSDGYAASTVAGSFAPSGPDVEVELVRGDVPRCEGTLHRNGEVLAGVSVTLAPESDRGWYQEKSDHLLDAVDTNAAGQFEFRAPAGFYVLRISLEGTVRLRSLSLPLAQPLLIDLGREASLQVHVHDANGAPKAAHVVSLSGKSSGQRIRHTDARGDATFEGLVAGPCTVSVPFITTEGSFHSDFLKELELVDGQKATVDVVIAADEPRFARLVLAGGIELSEWRARDPWAGASWRKLEADGRVPVDIQKGVHALEFQRGGPQRWYFSLPKEPSPDLELSIDLGGPAYNIELVDATTRAPVPGAVLVGTPVDYARVPSLTVSASTDSQGMALLTGLAEASPQVCIRLRSFELNVGDLLRWGNDVGACGFEPSRPAGSPPVQLRIELPKVEEGRFSDLPELHLTGIIRFHGAGRSETPLNTAALLTQADGTLSLRATGSSCRTSEGGRYDVRLPLTPRARLFVYDLDLKKSLDPVEWEPTPGILEQQRDFDFP